MNGRIEYWKTLPPEILEKRMKHVFDYCEQHLDQMWAASIVSGILGCDFRDAKEWLEDYKNLYSAQEREK